MHFHFDKAQSIEGFAVENGKGNDVIKILTRTLVTSDEPEFYQYSESISNLFLNEKQISVDSIHQFLVLIHGDQSADLYVNDFPITLEIKSKKDIKAGEGVTLNDIADIRKVKFPDIEIKDTDKIIYCFKIGWRFGLFFDLMSRVQPENLSEPISIEKLDIEKTELSIGDLRRYLTFYHVYKVLESETQFEEMIKDGWFPFIEILANEYKNLAKVYENKFDLENRVKEIIDSFDEARIRKITNKWWINSIFLNKKELINAGINAYLQNNQDGFVNCIKNLSTEVEGILRKIYYSETGKGENIKSSDFINHIVEKAKKSSGSGYSLLLAEPFLTYLQDVVFASFNVEKGEVDMSRHTSSHGVAEAQQYTKARALQLILILDQIYFYY